ncbi:NAD(P)/FAD-dependent oxidoreductase [Pontibrevibacter nitratireducens]|uniref:NAD(P)/FAD-dependent oxidoreductase n=2 Tax=Pontivivens nitratireducens TaxID=2758038 RepID=A0A6G7VJ83_9RHOB|nr:NAD(P)/FAD-dependent oxidoreductase [Pontibrevibacter nitratireducens]
MPDADVIIVGAGLSGICAASLLSAKRPADRVIVLEARDAIGGTWDLFRYPGIRSDSDMHTLGYSFRPWRGQKAITDGGSILSYIRDTAREQDVERLIRFGHRLLAANWDGVAQHWALRVQTPEGQITLTTRFLLGCTGYYDYEAGYQPDFAGQEDFAGPLVHPQHWPEGLDWHGKRIAVIGSGATAITLVPELARKAAHVSMIQRIPSYVAGMPARDRLGDRVKRILPERAAYAAIRWKNILLGMGTYQATQLWPGFIGRLLARKAAERSGTDPADFHAPYGPWEQRLCLAPDGDLFDALRTGRASITTGQIAGFAPDGVRMESGDLIRADVIVVATGLRMRLGGGAALSLDGAVLRFADHVSYKGAMLSGVPNFAQMFGYTNASWTLKCELIARWVIRLLNRMEAVGATVATPVSPQDLKLRSAVPLSSGYVQRAHGSLPMQGDRGPWRVHQNYLRDVYAFRYAPVDDGAMVLSTMDQSFSTRA